MRKCNIFFTLPLLPFAAWTAVIAPHNPDVVTMPILSTSTTAAPSSTALAAGPSATGIANSSSTTNSSKPIDCNQPQDRPDPSCWHTLNITGYLQDWANANEQNCTNRNLDFSSCFQGMLSKGGQNCSIIGGNTCNIPNPFDFSDPREFYVLWNIYAINNYFANFYNGVANARGVVAGEIAGFVQMFNPLRKKDVAMADFLLILSAVFCFARVPGNIKLPWQEDYMADSLLAGLAYAPTASRFIFPFTGNTQSQVDEFAKVGTSFSDMTSSFQSNVSMALRQVNGNLTAFNAVAGTGVFSQVVTDVQTITTYLTRAFYTYVISQLMVGNQIYVTTSHGWNPCFDDAGNYYPVPENGICGDNFYDNNTGIAYTMTSADNMFTNWTSTMTQLFESKTSGQLLFVNAKNCNHGNGANASLSVVTPNALNTTVGLSCISSAQVCPFNPSNYSSEYTNPECKQHKMFAVPNCKGDPTGKLVPAGYYGKYMDSAYNVCYHQ